MPALKGLAVSCKFVDDAALASLPDFPALRELVPMDVGDDGFRHIGRCQQLESLILMYCRDTTDVATSHHYRDAKSQEVSRRLHLDHRQEFGAIEPNQIARGNLIRRLQVHHRRGHSLSDLAAPTFVKSLSAAVRK